MYDVAIIGCGIVGAAAAYILSRYRLKILMLEKENDVADGTTKANSAILHAGYDPAPGTLMARLNVRGSAMAGEICKKLDVPYLQCGSLVLGFDGGDMSTLQKLYEQGVENGVPGLRLLDARELRELEPGVSPETLGALYAPSAAIVSPWEYALAMAETAVKNGAELRLNSPVTAIGRLPQGGYALTAGGQAYEARYVVNAAGVWADKVHNLIAEPAFEILPNRGQYYLLDKNEGNRVGHVVFQCPNKDGKGVLVSPTVHGNLIVGPNAEGVEGEDRSTTREGLDFVARMARKSVPSVDLRSSIRNFAGVRAQTKIDDFIIGEAKDAPGFFDLAGIKSPGLSAAPAIGEYLLELLKKSGLAPAEKEGFTDSRRHLRFSSLSPAEKAEAVRKNPAYGRVICRCETITEGEILDALHSPIPPVSVDGVKRRCNAGMGRCQGGFCGPRVVELLARERGVGEDEIEQDTAGTVLLTGRTKVGGGAKE